MKYLVKFLLPLFLILNNPIYSQTMEESIIELRTYNLKPGTREAFNKLFEEQALPLLKRWNIQVLSFGNSLQDENTSHLARAYKNLDHLNQSEDAFYSSPDWREGPREAILSLIENYTTLVLPASSLCFNQTIMPQMDDYKILSKLNAKFIQNFITQDTVSHNEIIHKDFICLEGNGKVVDRNQYMKDWATDYQNGKFTSFKIEDEHIRIFGNMALVRSKTVYTRQQNSKEAKGSSIYTDTYFKEGDRWWCVQAQITPIAK